MDDSKTLNLNVRKDFPILAKKILEKLYADKYFYHECSEQTKELFDKYYSEEAWLDDFQKVNKEFKNG